MDVMDKKHDLTICCKREFQFAKIVIKPAIEVIELSKMYCNIILTSH